MKTKHVVTLFVLITVALTSFSQGLSINAQDSKKPGAKQAEVGEAGRYYFRAELIPGLKYYDKLPEATFKPYAPMFAKIGRERIIDEMNAINKFTKGALNYTTSGEIAPIDAATAEGIWNSGRILRMRLELDGKFSFVSVANSLNGDADRTDPRNLYEGEEFFVLDLRPEGCGLFVLSSALCLNPPAENDLVFEMQEKDHSEGDGSKKRPVAHKKESQPMLTKEEQKFVDDNGKNNLELAKVYSGAGATVIINSPVNIVRSGDSYANATGGDAKADASHTGGSDGGSGTVEKTVKVKKYYEAADEQEDYENYSPAKVHRTTYTSNSGGCNNCSSNKSTPAQTVTAVGTTISAVADVSREVRGWTHYNDANITVNAFGNGNGGGGNTPPPTTGSGSGEMGYGTP